MTRAPLLAALLVPWAPSVALADRAMDTACADAYVQGQVLRKDHKLIEAREALRICVQPSCKAFIVTDCSAWLDMVQTSLPAVVLVASDEAGNALSDVKVSMDGAALVTALDGRSVEVNPGPHTFTFEAPDGLRVDRTVLVPEGERSVRVAVLLARSERPPPPPRPLRPAAPAPDTTFPWKTVGIALAGVGAIGVGGSVFFGLDAMSKKDAAGCNDRGMCPTAPARQTLSEAALSADLATWFAVAGGVLGTSGALLWVLAPKRHLVVAPVVGSTAASVVVAGVW